MTDGQGTWQAGGPSPFPSATPSPTSPPFPSAAPSSASFAAPFAEPSHPLPEQAPPVRPPSGLFPGGLPRPVYREPHPVRIGPLFAGLAAGAVWFALFGALGHDLATYAWWTIAASATAWLVALVLGVIGDRGVAVGVALASALGLSIAMGFVALKWIVTYDWPLW